jgi:O-antigen/teichoic acid export membrane protein
VTASVLTLTTVIEAFCAAIKPAASDLEASDDHARLRELTLLGQKYSLFMILPSAAFLLVMGAEFLSIWTQKDIPLLPTILAIVVAGHTFRLAQHSSFFVLVGMGEHRFFGRLMLLLATGTVVLGWASLALLDWGLLGVAWASALPLVLGCGVLLPRHVYQKLGIGWSESVRRVFAPALGGALPGILLLVAWEFTMPPRTWVELLLVVSAVAATTLVAAWKLGLAEAERMRFSDLARQNWSRLVGAGAAPR